MRNFLERLWSRKAPPAAPTPFTPIAATEPADVFIVAFPKSGMTWFQNLVVGTIYGLDAEQVPDTLVQDLVPDVAYKQSYKRYRTPMFFKSHHLPRPEYRRVVYLLRDGRDALVSFWHHLGALKQQLGPVDFLRMVQEGTHLPCKWQCHVAEWQANPFGAETLIIRYEDLQVAPVRELVRFCAFVGEAREPALLARVAEKCSFAAMRQREQRFGWDNANWPKDQPFVRRGVVGSYKDEMPADVLEAFLAEAGEILRQVGYL
jgi:hypothetical protein